jgi:polycomb protein EED
MIASAADDTTVRVWSLAAVHKKQPCVALLAGEGHQWNLLTLVHTSCMPFCDRFFLVTNTRQAWHSTGRYLLSAGHDQVVNMVSSAYFIE